MNRLDELQEILGAIVEVHSASESFMEEMHSADKANWDSRVHCFLRQAKLNVKEQVTNETESARRKEIERQKQKQAEEKAATEKRAATKK